MAGVECGSIVSGVYFCQTYQQLMKQSIAEYDILIDVSSVLLFI